jgi:hypothetical protein
MLPRQFDSLVAIARVENLPTILIEDRGEHPAAIGVVVDD